MLNHIVKKNWDLSCFKYKYTCTLEKCLCISVDYMTPSMLLKVYVCYNK